MLKATIIFIAILIFGGSSLNGQSRVIYGRVIDEDMETVPAVNIRADTSVIGQTDMEGRFRINVPSNTQTLTFLFVGMKTTTIHLNSGCDTVELVMMGNYSYDFISLRKVNRLELKRFKKLPELHLQAYKKGIFLKEDMCYSMEFIPIKY